MLVNAGELNLVGAIEVARHDQGNPEIPDSLKEAYETSLSKALTMKPTTEANSRGYYVIHASLAGYKDLARALELMDVQDLLKEHGYARNDT